MKTSPVIVSLIMSALSLHAQLVADGAANTLANVTTNIIGDMTVGTNGSFTLLVLSDNTLVTNSANGRIGLNVTAKSNEVRLVSSTARWQMGGSLYLGSNGALNRLIVSNGAFLNNNHGRLAFQVESSNNFALVTGSGSIWSNAGTLTIGNSGRSNQLIVSNGGRVISQNGDVGGNASGSNNLALLTGSGSVWSNWSNLRVGALSPGNRLVIESGGRVHSGGATVGQSSSASNNSVLVTGSDSLWTNDGGLTIGSQIGFNRLVVSNGAAVRSGSGGMGSLAAAVSNQVVVLGAGSIWSNQTTLLVGGNSAGNRADVTEGGWLACSDGTVGQSTTANGNTVTVSGSGSGWNNRGNLFVGDSGSGNVLIVSNGATALASNLFVGLNSASTNNRVIVNGGTLHVTNTAGTGVLDVRRGTNQFFSGLIESDRFVLTNMVGTFEFLGGTLVTRGASISNSPTFVVGTSGTNPAIWDVRAAAGTHLLAYGPDLIVGSNSSFNQLLITNGAVLTQYGSDGFLGFDTMAVSNVALVSGAGSQWSNATTLYVGYNGAGNRLIVSDGAELRPRVAYLGRFVTSSNNVVIVTGAGSVWRSDNICYFGYQGSGNQLIVSNAAIVQNGIGVIGETSDSRNNVLIVTGTGSVWSNMGNIYVGHSGTGNRLIVTDGGTVVGQNNLFLGYSLATNCHVKVDGGSLLVTTLNVSRGTNQLDAGFIDANFVCVTNATGQFEFNGGTLRTKAITNDNGRVFVVGDGTRAATLEELGGSSTFANDLIITNNATLTGNGTNVGTMAVSAGGIVSPGDGIGTLVFSNTPSLGGTVFMEIFKIGSTRFFDQIQVATTLLYGGTLTVSNLGVTAFSAGDNFKLFNAPTYGSSFASLNLPPLNAGLGWTNKLTVDGSIEVVTVSISQPKIASITLSGTNVIFSGTNGTPNGTYAVLAATNVTLPASNWMSIATNQFGLAGEFSFTNGIASGIPQRFFRLRVP